ncbi:MAG: VWA domain-containing protein, partial [Planctomycetes bacterium]|nr:VWA domain-containing protein [Planctomycetota bacterium]
RDQVAQVVVRAVFHNPNPFELEGTYMFPIAEDVTVSSFSMRVDGKDVQAELVDAERARRIYEEIVRRRRDPGLLEFAGDRMLRARVFPILPQKDVAIELRYDEILRSEGGLMRFHYPLRSAKPAAGSIDDVLVAVELTSKEPLKNIYSPTHDVSIKRKGDREARVVFEAAKYVPQRDFELYALANSDDIGVSFIAYEEKDEDKDGDSKATFLLLVSPRVELPATETIAKRVVFVLDRSGSMAGKKLEQAKEALRFCVASLGRNDAFDIVPFGTDVDAFREALAPASKENVDAATGFIDGIQAIGGTAIRDALVRALEILRGGDGSALNAIVFLTDGRPTIGETKIESILAEVKRANDAKTRVFAFGVGDDVNTDLLDRLAVDNRGTREYVRPDEDLEIKVSSFFQKIASPVLSDVKLSFSGITASEVYPRAMPDIFRGSQVAVTGRYEGAGRGAVVLEGNVGGRQHHYEYAVSFEPREENAFVPRFWAVRKVAFLLEEIRLHGRDEELVKEIVRLGKRYGIVTPYTSFLILDERELAAAPEMRRELRRLEESFERDREGKDAVDAASAVARGSAAAPAPAGEAGGRLGGAFSGRVRKAAERVPAAGRPGDSAGLRLVREDAIVRAGEKTFYAKADGLLHDSEYREGMPVEDIEALSDRYFALLGEIPQIGIYYALNRDLVVCIGGKAYRITGHEAGA